MSFGPHFRFEDSMKRVLFVLALVGLSAVAAPGEASARGSPLRTGAGLIGQAFLVRLYYSNAFRSYIPGTGYGGFARPAFGYRGY